MYFMHLSRATAFLQKYAFEYAILCTYQMKQIWSIFCLSTFLLLRDKKKKNLRECSCNSETFLFDLHSRT